MESPPEVCFGHTTLEGRQAELIALSYDVAEEQIRSGTAAPSTLNHFLKLGTIQAQTELELLRAQTNLANAKSIQLQQQAHIDELYSQVLDAMQRYGGYNYGAQPLDIF